MPPDQDCNQHQPPSFWDFIPGLAQNRPGNGVDHHNPQPTPQFSGGFPFGGPWHHGLPPPSHHHHGGPPHHPPPPPWVGRGPWEADFDRSQWYGHERDHDYDHGHDHDHNHDRHERHSRRHGCRRRGRHHRHCDEGCDEDAQRSSAEKEAAEKGEKGDSPETMDADADMPDPDEVAPEDGEYPPPPYGAGRRAGRFHRGGGGWRRGGRGHHGGWGGRHCPRDNSFDLPSMMRGIMSHPFFQSVRDQAERYRGGNDDDDDTHAFQPPVDIFNTESSFVVHAALPGAKKDDMGVNWNSDTSTLSIAGVLHRPGDEAFLQGLVSAERRVGVFERNITLPPAGVVDKETVDGQGITAKMEDGVLVVVVPKAEREWTEIRKVDVQ